MKNQTIKQATPERQLINEDQGLLDNLLNHAQRIYPAIKGVKVAYEELKLGSFTNEVYQQLVKGGLPNIKERYTQSIEQMLDKLNIHLQAMRNNFKIGTQEPIINLGQAWKKVVDAIPPGIGPSVHFPLELITIVEGQPTLTEESKEQLLEDYCRIYIDTTGPESELLEALNRLATAYNQFIQLGNKLKFTEQFHIQGLVYLDKFLRLKADHTAEVRPDSIKGVFAHQERLRKYNSL